jgi:hypothetical protein
MTTAPDQQLKRMKLRYAGTCRTCATPLPAGTLAIYDRASRLVTCLACLPVLAGPASAVAEPSGPPPVSPPAHATPREDCRRLDGDWVDLAANVPGQAVRALAEAELAAMRQRSRLGTVIARAFDVKTDERAWRVGLRHLGSGGCRGVRSGAMGRITRAGRVSHRPQPLTRVTIRHLTRPA